MHGPTNASSNNQQENYNPALREKAANHGRLDARLSRKPTVLFKYGVLTNKAKIFEIHLRCADPRSILATMFHGQKVLSARPKPCCRLAEFQIRLSSKIFLQTPQKSNVSIGCTWVQTWRPGNSEVPRPLRTARSRSRLPTRPSVKPRSAQMNAPGPRWWMQACFSYAWRKTSLVENNGERMQAGKYKGHSRKGCTFHFPKMNTPFPLMGEILKFLRWGN